MSEGEQSHPNTVPRFNVHIRQAREFALGIPPTLSTDPDMLTVAKGIESNRAWIPLRRERRRTGIEPNARDFPSGLKHVDANPSLYGGDRQHPLI